ncbi:MAG: alpha/beta hydrolase [Acetobacteraceae bacterium]
MLRLPVNGYDMSYIDLGEGPALVCLHGSLGDFRVWSSVLGPLSRRHRVIVPSLRHFFPEHWDGSGGSYTIAQHIADAIGFIEALAIGPVHLMGHSRGGHIAFRVAQQRPDLLRRLVLAEPGGDLDASLAPPDLAHPPMRTAGAAAAERIAAGDVDGGLAGFIDALEGKGAWRALPGHERQQLRDNAMTLLGQINEQRRPYSRADAEGIRVPTLFVGGERTPGLLAVMLRALAAHVPGAQVAIIPKTTHFMFGQDPVGYCAAVLPFLAE